MDKPASPIEDEKDDGWGGLTNIDDGNSDGDESASEIIPEDQLPFDIMKLVEEDMEEDINSIHTSMVFCPLSTSTDNDASGCVGR